MHICWWSLIVSRGMALSVQVAVSLSVCVCVVGAVRGVRFVLKRGVTRFTLELQWLMQSMIDAR
jgi:hypothetical protein